MRKKQDAFLEETCAKSKIRF